MPFFSRNSSASSSNASLPEKPVGPPTSEVILTPPEGTVVTKKWEYTEAQQKQMEELKQYTATLLLPETDDYHVWEKRFLSDIGTHARYMRAAKWKMDDAKKRIKGTIEWRREYRPELIEPGDVSVEAETGKIIITGFDRDARPIIYMRPGRENTPTSPRQIRHLIFNLERAIDIMPEGQEQVAIIVDYKSATSASNPSVSTGLKVLHILQNHYVERLGRGLVVNMPWWINAFFSGITPFMDPITRDKIRFNPKLPELIDPVQLDKEYGGEYNFTFDHKTYWPTLTKFCCLAEDGTRVDNEGRSFIPQSGNGITWAEKQHEQSEGGAKVNGEAQPEVKGNGDAAAVSATPAAEPATPAAEPVTPVAEPANVPTTTPTTTAPAAAPSTAAPSAAVPAAAVPAAAVPAAAVPAAAVPAAAVPAAALAAASDPDAVTDADAVTADMAKTTLDDKPAPLVPAAALLAGDA